MSKFNSLLLAVVFMFLLPSCSTTYSGGTPVAGTPESNYLAALDHAEIMLAEWGSATASRIQFTSSNDTNFGFDLNKTPTDYFSSAKTNKSGGASLQDQLSISLGVAAQSSQDLFQQQRIPELISNYEANKALEQQNSDDYAKALEELEAKRRQQEELALENYTACIEVADALATEANALEDKTEKETMLKSSVDQRNSCLDKYRSHVPLTAPGKSSVDTTFPTLDTNNVPAIEKNLASLLDNKASLDTPEALRNSTGLTASGYSIPDHEAIRQAASNYFLQQMFKVMGEQAAEHELLKFGVSMFSVNPGWRSKEGYKAQIDIQGQISYQHATNTYIKQYIKNQENPDGARLAIAKAYDIRDLDTLGELHNKSSTVINNLISTFESSLGEDKDYNKLSADKKLEEHLTNLAPVRITAISPTSMAQTLDLDSTFRRDFLFAISLSEALRSIGNEAQAEFFAEYARRQQRSAASATAANSVNVYSYGNSVVGAEVGPMFQALDPDQNDASNILQQQTFPVLLLAKSDVLGPKIMKNCILKQHCLLQPAWTFYSTSRWQPVDKSWLAFLGKRPTLLKTSQVRKITGTLKACERNSSGLLKIRCVEMTAKLGGTFDYENIEKKSTYEITPVLSSVFPNKIVVSADKDGKFDPVTHDFVVTGQHLKNLKIQKQAGVPTNIRTLFSTGQKVTDAQLEGENLKISVELSNGIKQPVAFVVQHEIESLTTATQPVGISEVRIVKIPEKTKPTAVKNTVMEISGNRIVLPDGVNDIPANITKILESDSYDTCKRSEKKQFKLGDKIIEVPEGYCDVPENVKALLNELAKQP